MDTSLTDSLKAHIAEMTHMVTAMSGNMDGARMYASTPDGRQKMVELQRDCRQWAAALRICLRQLDKADRLLTRALKAKGWGVRL